MPAADLRVAPYHVLEFDFLNSYPLEIPAFAGSDIGVAVRVMGTLDETPNAVLEEYLEDVAESTGALPDDLRHNRDHVLAHYVMDAFLDWAYEAHPVLARDVVSALTNRVLALRGVLLVLDPSERTLITEHPYGYDALGQVSISLPVSYGSDHGITFDDLLSIAEALEQGRLAKAPALPPQEGEPRDLSPLGFEAFDDVFAAIFQAEAMHPGLQHRILDTLRARLEASGHPELGDLPLAHWFGLARCTELFADASDARFALAHVLACSNFIEKHRAQLEADGLLHTVSSDQSVLSYPLVAALLAAPITRPAPDTVAPVEAFAYGRIRDFAHTVAVHQHESCEDGCCGGDDACDGPSCGRAGGCCGGSDCGS